MPVSTPQSHPKRLPGQGWYGWLGMGGKAVSVHPRHHYRAQRSHLRKHTRVSTPAQGPHLYNVDLGVSRQNRQIGLPFPQVKPHMARNGAESHPHSLNPHPSGITLGRVRSRFHTKCPNCESCLVTEVNHHLCPQTNGLKSYQCTHIRILPLTIHLYPNTYIPTTTLWYTPTHALHHYNYTTVEHTHIQTHNHTITHLHVTHPPTRLPPRYSVR